MGRVIAIVATALAGLLPCVAFNAAVANDIKVYSYNLPPVTLEVGGEIIGPAASLVDALLRAAGLVQEMATAAPVARVLSIVEEGRALGFPLARDPVRESRFKWVVELYQDSFAFVTIAPAPAVNSFDQARGLASVGVNQASSPRNVLTAAGFTNLDLANSEAQNAAKLFAGNISTWFSAASTFRPSVLARGLDASKLVIGAPVYPISAWLIGSKDLPDDLVEKMRAAFAEMKMDGRYDAIMKGVVR